MPAMMNIRVTTDTDTLAMLFARAMNAGVGFSITAANVHGEREITLRGEPIAVQSVIDHIRTSVA